MLGSQSGDSFAGASASHAGMYDHDLAVAQSPDDIAEIANACPSRQGANKAPAFFLQRKNKSDHRASVAVQAGLENGKETAALICPVIEFPLNCPAGTIR